MILFNTERNLNLNIRTLKGNTIIRIYLQQRHTLGCVAFLRFGDNFKDVACPLQNKKRYYIIIIYK